MADPTQKRRKVVLGAPELPPVEETTTEPSAGQKVAGDITRTLGERAKVILPMIVRGGSGALAFEGGPTGALISGGGEALAQLLEGKKWNDLNWGHIGVESGLGLIPGSAMIKEGKALASGLRGAAMSGAGVVGRKAADVATGTNPDALKKENWSAWDALPVVLGGTMSGVAGKMTPVGGFKPKQNTTPYGPQTIEDFLSNRTWNPDKIKLEAAKLEASGQKEAADSLRKASLKTNTGDTQIYNDIAKSREAAAVQEAKNLSAGEKHLEKSQTEAFKDIVEKEKAHTTAAAMVDKEKKAALNAASVKAKRAALVASGAKPKTVVTRTSAMETPSGTVRATTILAEPKPTKGGAVLEPSPRGPIPVEPIGGGPKPDVFQVVSPTRGVVAEVPTLKEAEEAMSALGPGHKVVFPSNFKAEAAAATPKATPTAGTPPVVPFNPPRIVTEPPKATPATPPTPEVPKASSEAPVAPTSLSKAQVEDLIGPAGLPLTTAPEISSKLREVGAVPEGSGVLARFFRSRPAAEREGAYSELLPIGDTALPQMQPALAKNDALTRAQRASREPNAPARVLGSTLQRAGKELGLPPRPKVPKESEELAQTLAERSLAPNKGTPADVPNNPTAQLIEAQRKGAPQTTQAWEISPLEVAQAKTMQDTADAASNPAHIVEDFNKRVPLTERTPEQMAEADSVQSNLIQDALRKARGESGQIDPELLQALMTRVAPAAIGAAGGAAMDKENRLRGAMLGGAAGLYGPSAIKALSSKGVPGGIGPSLADRLVNWQRFALLTGPQNLAVNILAPTGGGALGSIEKMVQGGLERTGMSPVTNAYDLGKAGLKATFDPRRVMKFGRDIKEAGGLLEHSAERADLAGAGKALTPVDVALQTPGRLMTAGDIGERNALMGAGWSEAQARAVTNTSEPRYALTKGLTNLSRQGGAATRLALPFVKTTANVVESSLERTPVGLLLKMTKAGDDPKLQASLAEIVARQGVGAGVGLTAYMLGKTIDPETAKHNKLAVMISNLSGQYGSLAVAAFAAGQASQLGKDPVEAGTGRFLRDLPLPTTEVFKEMTDAANAYRKGEAPNPNAEHLPQQWLPDNMLPRFLKDETIDQVQEALPKRRVTLNGQ